MNHVKTEDIRTKDDFPEETHPSFFVSGKYLLDVLRNLNYCAYCDQAKGSCICSMSDIQIIATDKWGNESILHAITVFDHEVSSFIQRQSDEFHWLSMTFLVQPVTKTQEAQVVPDWEDMPF